MELFAAVYFSVRATITRVLTRPHLRPRVSCDRSCQSTLRPPDYPTDTAWLCCGSTCSGRSNACALNTGATKAQESEHHKNTHTFTSVANLFEQYLVADHAQVVRVVHHILFGLEHLLLVDGMWRVVVHLHRRGLQCRTRQRASHKHSHANANTKAHIYSGY